MATLYELTADYAQLLDLMGDPETDPQVIEDTMEGLEGELSMKLDSYVTVIKSLEADNEMDKKEASRLDNRVKTRNRNIEKLKFRMMEALKVTGLKKVLTEHYTVSRQVNGGKRSMVIAGDVPEEFYKMVPCVDKDRIRELLEAGQELDFANLEERGESLRIK